MTATSERELREARERVQVWLGLASLIIWLVATFVIVVGLELGQNTRAPRIMMAGLFALGIAALPWLGYRPLVRLAVDRAARKRDPASVERADPPGT